MTRRRAPILLVPLLLLAVLLPSAAFAKTARHLAVVLDTSTSMRETSNDRPRLAIQAIKILADMLGPEDRLTLTWMPDSTACEAQPDPALRIDSRGGDLSAFKQAVDSQAGYGGPTNFIVPLATAQQALNESKDKERLLVVISDAGRDSCRADSARILRGLRAAGVRTAAVSLGDKGKPAHAEYDIRTAAKDPSELLQAIGEIYQRFLGAKAPDSGKLSPASTRISAQVAPFVDEAFLLVAAEGPVGTIAPESGNPAADGIDPDYRAGETRGLDNLTRGYRILRLRRPEAGTWRFNVAGLTGEAGWYLIQDFSVSMRASTPASVAQGQDVPVTLELIDDRTGQRIQRPGQIPGLEAQALIEGRTYRFRDDGQEGDAKADDGLMTARVRFMKPGPATFPVRLTSRYIQDEQPQHTEVGLAAWALEVRTPPRTVVGDTIQVAVRIEPAGGLGVLPPPDRVAAHLPDGRTLDLGDDGRDGDSAAGDHIYARSWTPDRVGDLEIAYRAEGGGRADEAKAKLAVTGTLFFGTPGVLELGRLASRSEGTAGLDLGFVTAKGPFDLKLKSDFARSRSVLEIDLGQGFEELDGSGLDLRIQDGGIRRYPVRLRVRNCPEGVLPAEAGNVVLEATDHRGQPLRTAIPIRVEIVEDTWLHCWWPVIAAILLALLGLFILYGILSPARFPRNLAVILSPEADMDEGYPFNIRSQRGARSGFYRDARIHIATDFQLRRSASGALARLRADRLGVFIQPLPGNTVLQLDEDNRWEPLSTEQETRVRFSTPYKNVAETLFFEFRNL